MRARQTFAAPSRSDDPHRGWRLPALWLISDARNDAVLEQALRNLPRGSGFIFRHYHLSAQARRGRFANLAAIARRHGHVAILAGNARQARAWGADGAYGRAEDLGRAYGLRIATAHSLRELAAARQVGADAVLLSPVFPTRSHPGGAALGPLIFRLIARRAAMPVIALGGMDAARARRLRWRRWAAIDGLSGHRPPASPRHLPHRNS